MRVEDQLEEFNSNTINREPPPETLEKLMKLPYFRQSYEFDGMETEEFTRYAPLSPRPRNLLQPPVPR